MINSKKGFAWMIIWLPAIIIGLIALISGGLAAYKINDIIYSIPAWFWYALIGLIFLIIIKNKK